MKYLKTLSVAFLSLLLLVTPVHAGKKDKGGKGGNEAAAAGEQAGGDRGGDKGGDKGGKESKAEKAEAKAQSKAEKEAKKAEKAEQKAAKDAIDNANQKAKAPKGASKEEKQAYKDLNKSLKATKKLERDLLKAKDDEDIAKAIDKFENRASKINNGQRVSTMVKVAKSLGYSASVGALQANFGTPQETGIKDLQDQITAINEAIATLPGTIDGLSALAAELQTTTEAIAGEITAVEQDAATQIADIDAQLANPELTEEQVADLEQQKADIQSNTATTVASLETDLANTQAELAETTADIQTAETNLADATAALPGVEAELSATIEQTNIGNRDSGWTTVDLDTNGDGEITDADIVQ